MGLRPEEQPLRELLVPTRLQLERLREGRNRLARGAGRDVPADERGRSRLQSARLPEGRVLQRAHVRRESRAVSVEARGRAWRGEVEAGVLGRGAARDRRGVRGCDRERRSGRAPDRRGDRDRERLQRSGPLSHALHPRRSLHGHELGVRRPSARRVRDHGQARLLRIGGRLLLFRPDLVLGWESGLHADPQRTLHERGTLPRGARDHDRARLQRVGGPCGPVDPPRRGHGRGARSRCGARDGRRRAVRRGVPGRADGHAAARAHGHGRAAARARRRGRRCRRSLLRLRSRERRGAPGAAAQPRARGARARARWRVPRAYAAG